MDTSKILSADLLDLIFDDRNKDYGAYELRKTYNRRITKSLVFTFTLAALALGGSVLARSMKPGPRATIPYDSVVVAEIPPDKQEPEKIVEPERQPEPEPTRAEQFTEPLIVPESEVDEPPPTQEELSIADIDVADRDGDIDKGISQPSVEPIDSGKGIIEKRPEPETIYTTVQVEARYSGNWEKFLHRNLDPNVPVDNGAPTGRYTVTIKFVVDKEGNVSDLVALSNVGYGMEQEALRVLKRADKWEPAIQSGYKVKAYRLQRITFEVLGE